ncbi:unnamed protein product [Amoebophrya sp. A25]|nr:unnamed protein product [Amoebophrya sp. A25]|eukprot:GSA25T00001344001.1
MEWMRKNWHERAVNARNEAVLSRPLLWMKEGSECTASDGNRGRCVVRTADADNNPLGCKRVVCATDVLFSFRLEQAKLGNTCTSRGTTFNYYFKFRP